jgi:hypothetical protein
MDQKTRSLAQEIYSRGLVSLSSEVQLIKDLEYEIYKLKQKHNSLRERFANLPYPGECPYEMNDDRCKSFEGNCELCIFVRESEKV